MSPSIDGASRSSPGPMYEELESSAPAMIFFMLNLTSPLRVIVGDIAIMAPGLAVSGQPMASWMVRMVLQSRWLMR